MEWNLRNLFLMFFLSQRNLECWSAKGDYNQSWDLAGRNSLNFILHLSYCPTFKDLEDVLFIFYLILKFPFLTGGVIGSSWNSGIRAFPRKKLQGFWEQSPFLEGNGNLGFKGVSGFAVCLFILKNIRICCKLDNSVNMAIDRIKCFGGFRFPILLGEM